MYKSKYDIPLIIENTLPASSRSTTVFSLGNLKLSLSFLFRFLLSTLSVFWALLLGIASFFQGVWKENPWIKGLPWVRISILAVLAYVLIGKGLGVTFELNNPFGKEALVLPATSESTEEETISEATDRTKDLSPISPALLKHPHVKEFVDRFQPTAIEEMKLFGIPASIKMGQAIIESQAGKSVLASTSNNFFGIKCKAKCLGCTCKNYEDDNKYDMFRVFDSPWESWRAHSKLLCNPRYAKLPLYGKDYKKWAQGLKDAGYATDPNYATKLITVIEKYNLTMLDRM